MIAELARTEIDELLHAQLVGRIGCHAGGLTYVVPVIYAYDGDALYVASAEGQKLRMMRANPSVCFEVDEYDGRGSWRSVVVQGAYEALDAAASTHALALLAARFAPSVDGQPLRRRDQSSAPFACFRIRVVEATGRAVERAAPRGAEGSSRGPGAVAGEGCV